MLAISIPGGFRMSLFGFARVALMAVAAASICSAASAQVTGYVVSRTATVRGFQPGGTSGGFNSFLSSGPVPDGNSQFATSIDYGTYQNLQITTNVGAGHIDFANNVSVMGVNSFAAAETIIAVEYKNGTLNTVTPRLTSTISPAGFGVYSATVSGNPSFDPLTKMIGDINTMPGGTQNQGFLLIPGWEVNDKVTLGWVDVGFQILNGADPDNLTILTDYSARLDIYLLGGGTTDHGPTSTSFELVQSSLTGLTLNNFRPEETNKPDTAVGYMWDATPVVLSLGSLGAGESSKLIYKTRVSASMFLGAGYIETAMLAYAGFGDPLSADAGGGGIADPDFPLITLGLPSFDPVTGEFAGASFEGIQDAPLPLRNYWPSDLLPPTDAAVPEPATWALLITGFGLAGGALRRRTRIGLS